jgi:hypothetical protein
MTNCHPQDNVPFSVLLHPFLRLVVNCDDSDAQDVIDNDYQMACFRQTTLKPLSKSTEIVFLLPFTSWIATELLPRQHFVPTVGLSVTRP